MLHSAWHCSIWLKCIPYNFVLWSFFHVPGLDLDLFSVLILVCTFEHKTLLLQYIYFFVLLNLFISAPHLPPFCLQLAPPQPLPPLLWQLYNKMAQKEEKSVDCVLSGCFHIIALFVENELLIQLWHKPE